MESVIDHFLTKHAAPRRDRVLTLAWIAVGLWLAGTVVALWGFEGKYWRPFANARPGHPLGEAGQDLIEDWYRKLALAKDPAARLTVVHLHNPDCPCNRYTEPHLEHLLEAYRPRGVRFVAAAAASRAEGNPSTAPRGLPLMTRDVDALRGAGVDSAPALLIFSAAGRLLYYGPYSDGPFCGARNGLAEGLLDRALAGRSIIQGVPDARGCFCAW